MIAVSVRETEEYVLKEDRGTERPSVFVLRPLKQFERVKMMDLLALGTKASAVHMALKFALVDWRDVYDDSGNAIAMMKDGKKVSDSSLELIPFIAQMEIGDHVIEQNTVSEDEAKN